MPRNPSPRLDRMAKAHLHLARAASWIEGETRDGRKFYGIPSESRPGLYHLTNGSRCTCESFVKLAELSGSARACAHMLAVQLHFETVRSSILDLGEETAPHLERAALARGPYRQVAQEILSATLTRRQLNAKKYHDIFPSDE